MIKRGLEEMMTNFLFFHFNEKKISKKKFLDLNLYFLTQS